MWIEKYLFQNQGCMVAAFVVLKFIAFGVWKWFGQLVKLIINPCDMLIYWPEVEFRSLVSFKFFYISHCSKLIGPTKVKACCTRGRDQLLPNLKNLIIKYCECLIKLFVLPPSLTSIRVSNCVIVESIPGQDDKELESLRHFDTVASSEHSGGLASTSMTE